jgi:hypothetical protein
MKLTIEEWIALNYSGGPTVSTVRRWCRDGLLYPAPIKEGRSYYLLPNSRYTPPKPSLIQRLNAPSLAEPQATPA